MKGIEMRSAHESEDEARSPQRMRTWQALAAGFGAGVTLTVPVMLVTGDTPATPPELSPTTAVLQSASTEALEAQATTTVAGTVSPEGPAIERTDLNASDTSFGTLRWTRVSGDVDSVPGRAIQQRSDGTYVSTEGNRKWQSDDGLTWTYATVEGLEEVHDVWLEDDWAIAWSYEIGTSTVPAMSRLFERDDTGWTEVALPAPSLPEIDGIVWSVAVAMPIELSDRTFIQASARGEIPWGDHYGVPEVPCGTESCERGPFGHLEHDDLWTIVPAAGGFPIATVEMTIVDDTIEFVDTESGELVHIIAPSDSMSAQQIAHQLTSGMSVSGAFVQDGAAPFAFHETPFTAQLGNLFSVADGGFAALEIQEQGFGSIDATMWTSDDGITWTDRGTPSFLDESAEWITIDQRDGTIVAHMILDSGSASGEETFETFETTNGVDWLATEPSQFPLFTRFHETSFADVAIAMPQSRHDFWLSADGESWEEVEGPPGPHEPNGGGMSDAGAAGEILWVLVADDGGSRTLWIGTFDD